MRAVTRSRLFTAALLPGLVLSLLLAAPPTAQASGRRAGGDVSLPAVAGPIKVTANSRPFIDRLGPPRIAAKKAGYVEREYFVSGKANVYTWSGDQPVVRTADAPYTTRILVRMPAKAKKFSGNVWVEPLNPTLGIDLDRMWQVHYDQILRDGDAWVGITSKPITIAALQKFDSVRYGSLSMANPLPPEQQTCGLLPGEPGFNLNTSRLTENGLIWDIMSQVGALLKSNTHRNPLPKAARVVYGEGWSQTGGYANRYLSTFGPLAKWKGRQIYDGWLVGGPTGPTAINQCESVTDATDPRQQIKPNGVPVITFRTESDTWSFNYRRPDGDSRNDRFRLYEMAGTSQDTASIYENFPPDADVLKAGVTPVTTEICGFVPPTVPTDFPYEYFFNAGAVNLKKWRVGIRPPKAERYAYAGTTIVRDEYGNALGGLRSPYVDVPIASYSLPPGPPCPYIGTKTPLSQAQLDALYRSHGKYVKAVAKSTAKLVRDRFVLPRDGARIVTEAVRSDVP
ncbi:MAG: hypothetical protein KJ041_10075 [Gammaproteobacteria bacterium]|nr:hypothetical protein [Gammaproteobacteria bacterium]